MSFQETVDGAISCETCKNLIAVENLSEHVDRCSARKIFLSDTIQSLRKELSSMQKSFSTMDDAITNLTNTFPRNNPDMETEKKDTGTEKEEKDKGL